MNAAAVFISLLFWGWLWGIWGMLLSIPIIVIAKVGGAARRAAAAGGRSCWATERGATRAGRGAEGWGTEPGGAPTSPRTAPLVLPTSCSVLADLVADDAADDGAAHGSDRAAAGEDRSSDRSGAGTDGGVLVLLRHPGATRESEQRGRRDGAHYPCVH